MDGISWGDLERDEQRAIAILGAGLPLNCAAPCSPGVRSAWAAAHNLRRDAVLKCVSGSAPVDHDRGWDAKRNRADCGRLRSLEQSEGSG